MNQQQETRAELEQALQKTHSALEREREARQAFVSLVTHELRAPMTSIKGYTDLLLKGMVGSLNDPQTEFLETIRANVERMSKLVSDLSDINKIEGDRLVLHFSPVAVQPTVEEALEAFKATVAEKRQVLTTEIPQTVPPVWADRSQLLRVVRMLLSNATLYTHEGGDITVRVGMDEDHPGQVRIAVRDTGIGIPADEQDQIFDVFFRASDEETRAVRGNGLSLHLAKKLIERHQGDITFESERGEGSLFVVSVPVAASQMTT